MLKLGGGKASLTTSRAGNVYTINFHYVYSKHLVCFKVINDDVWLLHIREHASMHILEKLSKHDLVRTLPKYKYDKDQVYSAYVGDNQVRASLKPLKIVQLSNPFCYCIWICVV